MEGVKGNESNDVHNEAHPESKGNLPEVLSQLHTSVLEVIDKQTWYIDSSTIHDKDAPIGQHLAWKVPVAKFFKRIHACNLFKFQNIPFC